MRQMMHNKNIGPIDETSHLDPMTSIGLRGVQYTDDPKQLFAILVNCVWTLKLFIQMKHPYDILNPNWLLVQSLSESQEPDDYLVTKINMAWDLCRKLHDQLELETPYSKTIYEGVGDDKFWL